MEELKHSRKPTITKSDLLKVLNQVADDALIVIRYKNLENSIQEIIARIALREDLTKTRVVDLILNPDDNIENFIDREKAKQYLNGRKYYITDYEKEINQYKEKIKKYQKEICDLTKKLNMKLNYSERDYLEKILDEKYDKLSQKCKKSDRQAIKEMNKLMHLIDVLSIIK